ncbi:hypothetical protein ACIA71_26990 [Streptomyces anulatus]
MAQQNLPFAAHLARIAPDTAAWRTGPPSTIAARLLLAAHHALTTPLDQALPTGPRVSTAAARSRSTTAVPDTAPPKQPAPTEPTEPTEPAAPAHRPRSPAGTRTVRGGHRSAVVANELGRGPAGPEGRVVPVPGHRRCSARVRPGRAAGTGHRRPGQPVEEPPPPSPW